MFNSKGRYVRQSQVEKFTRYSIRKVSFGAASVAVATGLFFLGGGSVQAAEPVINSEPTEVQNSQNLNDKSSEPSKEVTGQASATAKEPDGQNNTSLKESDIDTQASAVETPNVVTEKVTINTASLEDLVAKAESRLSQLTEGKKTKSVIDDAKNLVHKAKELLNDGAKTQAKVDALAKQLSSGLSILNSIKSETTEEEKVNKNQDPRNGKEIPGKGESGLRAPETQSNNDVSIDGGKIIANGSISTEPRMGSFSGVNNISYNLKFKDGAYKRGDQFSITFEELGNGDSLPKTLTKDGKTFANLVKSEELYTQTYGKNGTQNKTPFWAQRDDSVSLEEKEAGHIQNRGTKTRFIYEFTSAIESLNDVSVKGSINNYSLRYPQISEDKEVTSRILVNNQPVVEKKYIMNKTNIETDDNQTAPSRISTTGEMDISDNGELLSHTEELQFRTNKYEYEAGTTFKIKLKNKDLNKFSKIGNFNVVKANLQNNTTTANSKVNENGVILKEPRGDVFFQVINLTEDEVTVKIVKGKASKGILYRVDWGALGVSREPVKNTLNLYNKSTKTFGPTEEEITVSKDGQEGNLNGQFTPNITFDWKYPKKNEFDTSGNWLKEYLELGNVAMRYINAANNRPILKAKSIVKDGTAEVDKFTTATPAKDFTEANVATETNNTTKK